jgi:hypothetical protein
VIGAALNHKSQDATVRYAHLNKKAIHDADKRYSAKIGKYLMPASPAQGKVISFPSKKQNQEG